MAVTVEQVNDALRQCFDPEIPVNILDLGLIYDVAIENEGDVRIRMTLTTQFCPSAQEIPEQVRQRVAAIPETNDVQVEIVWHPPWDPTRITPEGRKQLGIEV